MLLKLMALLSAAVHMVSAQGGSPNVLHQGESGDVQSVIVTSKTRAFLSCESGDIVVKVNFTLPFRGLMYAHRSRNSQCRVHGAGGHYYELRIPLKGCGTWQESPRVFMNNITIRFHPALELEEDETKTVVCRYPPPLTPAPGSINVISPVTLSPSQAPTRVGTAKLSEVEILIIICVLLFLSLVTLGIGIAYFCLKRRNIRIIRKSLMSSAPGSQLTKLSSSRAHPPSSLLSSVLGHTVRIPRAVPYSAPSLRTGGGASSAMSDHQYEGYPQSSSTSGEVSETSSSSLAEDHVDASKHLIFKKSTSRSLLSIPKAILRKNGFRAKTVPSVHQRSEMVTIGGQYRSKVSETEDQTVTTVLEHENNVEDDGYYAIGDDSKVKEKNIAQEQRLQGKGLGKTPDRASMPVYAQVDKRKKRLNATEDQRQRTQRSPVHWSIRSVTVPGTAKKHEIITEVPEEAKTTEEVTKNTTVTTSVRKEITETRLLSPTGLYKRNGESQVVRGGVLKTPSPSSELDSVTEASPSPNDNKLALQPHRPPKSILIQDVADVYVTTTVETELRETKTTVSHDVTEERARADRTSPEVRPQSTSLRSAASPTDNWNVVIRQRKPLVESDSGVSPTVLDSDSGSNREGSSDFSDQKPHFDVTIRSIHPDDIKPKKLDTMMSIPPLEMPKAVNKLREALSLHPKTQDVSATKDGGAGGGRLSPLPRAKARSNQRTVRWFDDAKDFTTIPEEESSLTSSDSFRSEESLRERSSSEVLEVAPTLPGHRRNSDHPMLERSTSEIVTSPEDHVRWIGGVVPVLESLSPEFLANIPVVSQGGFFNKERSQSSEKTKKDPA